MKKVKQLILTIGILLFSQNLIAQPNFSWVNTMGSTGNDFGRDIVVDAAGNAYIVGEFRNTVDFDPGAGTTNLVAFGNTDVFLQKLDNAGNLVWVKQLGGTNSDEVESISLDLNGDLVITGNFRGTADFDPGVGTTNLTATGSYNDTYIVKFDTNGNLIWVKQLDATHHCFVVDMGINSSNEILLTGRWYGTADFDPGAGTNNLAATGAGWDIYVLKLTSAGNFVWVSPVTGSDNNYNQALAVDMNDNVLISGYYYDLIDLDPGPGTVNYTAAPNQEDMFLLKLDNNGAYVWGQNYATPMATEITSDIYVDGNNDYYFGGWFSSALDFDLGPGNATLNTNGSGDCFLLKLNSAGTFQWVNHIGGTNTDEIRCITEDRNGDIIIAGFFDGTVDFDPGSGVDNISSTGVRNAFFQKVDPSGSYHWTVTMGGFVNDIFTSINGDIHSTGSFATTVDFDPGSGVVNATSAGSNDIFVHKIRECTPAVATDILTECDSVLWIDGNTYYSNNTSATHTLVNGAASGCDSIVTLNLTINNATNGTDVQTACGSYLWIDNNTYTSNNTTATHTIANGAASGCDSIVTLNLTINTVNNSTINSNDSITASASGATYQWLDCNNNYAVITGETNQLFVASANGNYAVEVTQNGCTDTSACIQVIGVGINQINSFGQVTIYPNPTSGAINIALGNQYNDISIQVKDVTGKLIDQRNYQSINQIEYNIEGERGIYFIELNTEQGERTTLKIIKQ